MNKLWHEPDEPEDSGDTDDWFQMEAQRDAESPDIEEIEKVMLESATFGDAEAQFDLGTFYYFSEKHDPIKSKEWLLKAANQDFAQAQHALWCMHEWGFEGSLSFKEAVRWLRRAAELDLAEAQFELSGLYMLGREDIEHDMNEVMNWLHKAAEQGHSGAQLQLGGVYYRGEGVEQSFEKAFEWHLKSAEQGDAWAQAWLSSLYFHGEGVEQDLEQALKWLHLSAEQGNDYAQCQLAGYYHMELDFEKAFEWGLKSAEQENCDAQCFLGILYYEGKGGSQDPKEAAKWFQLAAEGGDACGQAWLSSLYFHGEGVEQDLEQALKWLHLSAEQGNDYAQCQLGSYYYDKEDFGKAVEWYKKSAEQGDADAQCNVGFLYYQGEGVDQDPKEAAKWFRLAAEAGDACAQNKLGENYYDEEQYTKAFNWYEKAGEQGDADAQFFLGIMYVKGRGVTKDREKGYKWLRTAANQGDKFAWLHLPCTEVFRRIFFGSPETYSPANASDQVSDAAYAQKKATVRIGLPDQHGGAPEALPVPAPGGAPAPAPGGAPVPVPGGALYPDEIHFDQIPTLSHIDVVNEVYEEKRGHEKIKIIRDYEIYWKLITASYRGIESCFALTKDPEIEPLFKLTSEVNADWKIILMPLDEKTSCPAPEQFEQMKNYFLDEGYFENLKVWTDRLNKESVRFTDDNLEDLLTKTNPQAMLTEIDK